MKHEFHYMRISMLALEWFLLLDLVTMKSMRSTKLNGWWLLVVVVSSVSVCLQTVVSGVVSGSPWLYLLGLVVSGRRSLVAVVAIFVIVGCWY